MSSLLKDPTPHEIRKIRELGDHEDAGFFVEYLKSSMIEYQISQFLITPPSETERIAGHQGVIYSCRRMVELLTGNVEELIEQYSSQDEEEEETDAKA